MTHRQGDPFPLSVSLILFRKGRKGLCVMGKIYTFEDINNKLKETTTLELISIDGTNAKSKGIVYCNKCKATYEVTREKLTQWCGCSVCTGKLVVKGINDLATTAPWIMDYLKNKEDGYKYMKSANKKVDLICPNCKKESKKILNNLSKRGFSCNRCGDGISYPNKFIKNLLTKMKVDCLEFEYSPEWIKPQRFDSYFELNNNKYIVEMDGGLHFKDNCFGGIKRTKEEMQQIDKEKQIVAEQHGIEVIRINCIDINDIPKNILNSKLAVLFDLKNFDFINCQIESNKSSLLESCKDWNNGMCLKQIADKHNMCDDTIRKWLIRGAKLNLCDYTKEESHKRGSAYTHSSYLQSDKHKEVLERKAEERKRIELNKLKRQIYVYKNNKLIMICKNYLDCAKKIGELTNNPKACSQNIFIGIKNNTERYGFTYKTYQMVQEEQSLHKGDNINE